VNTAAVIPTIWPTPVARKISQPKHVRWNITNHDVIRAKAEFPLVHDRSAGTRSAERYTTSSRPW
jgi:hypothetical protein